MAEDVGEGDHSSLAAIPALAQNQARLIVKDEGILAGVELAVEIFRAVDPELKVNVLLPDGTPVKHSDIAFTVQGKAQSILTAERLVLNCMQRMSGVATLTHKLTQLISGTKAKLLDTRKTTPNFRMMEKWAVVIGGGHNHRFGLYDMVMLKDNHIDFCGGIEKAIEKTNAYLVANNLPLAIEVETRSIEDVMRVLEVGNISRIMLDNYTPQDVEEAVQLIAGRFETEASGGINIDNVEDYARAGVDFISVGAIIHHAVSLDLSLKAQLA